MNNFSALKQDKTAVLHETVLQVKALIGQGVYFSTSLVLTYLELVLLQLHITAAAEFLFTCSIFMWLLQVM